MTNVLPFRGRKPTHTPVLHPAPWRVENGIIRDANGRVVGSTIQPATADWIVRTVNLTLEPDPPQA